MKKTCYLLLFACVACLSGRAQPPCQTVDGIIRAVSINGSGRPEIVWDTPSPLAADATGYIIYDYLGGAACTSPIDTVDLLTNSYVHTTAPVPPVGPRSYTMAVNTLIEPYPLTQPHAYSFLTAAYDSCTYAIALQWTPYEGWGQPATYNVYGGLQGNPPALMAANVGGTSYVIENVPDNVAFEVHVVAVHPADPAVQSTSNRVALQTTTSQRPGYMYIRSIDYEENRVSLQFDIDPATKLPDFTLARSTSPDDGYGAIHAFSDAALHSFVDNQAPAVYYYRLTANNYCRLPAAQSNVLNNIGATMEAQNGTWYIAWDTLYGAWASYGLQRLQPLPAVLLANVSATAHSDAIDLSEPELTYCYQIDAYVVDFDILPFPVLPTPRSTTKICGTYRPEIAMPDAIDPKSTLQNPQTGRQRNQFGPVVYAAPATYGYRLEIYSRNGDRMAAIEKKEHDSPLDKSWTGVAANGDFVAEGTYVYHLHVTYANGTSEKRTGTVAVIYE
jgi:hypothetical protein